MDGQTVAVLESRLGEQLAELIAKRGGKPLHAPALAEMPDFDAAFIERLVSDLTAAPVKAAIFQTGVGTQALFKATDALGLTPTLLNLLAATTVVVRGPKPTGALRARGVRIDLSAKEPYTTTEVLAELGPLELNGERVVVQRYGAKNPDLERGLQVKGATVIDIPLYRWSLPKDIGPMVALINALEAHQIDSAVFTSASQIHNLFQLAETLGKNGTLAQHLNATLVASIGPVCTAALAQHGVKAALEAHPPKLGPLLNALDEALSRP